MSANVRDSIIDQRSVAVFPIRSSCRLHFLASGAWGLAMVRRHGLRYCVDGFGEPRFRRHDGKDANFQGRGSLIPAFEPYFVLVRYQLGQKGLVVCVGSSMHATWRLLLASGWVGNLSRHAGDATASKFQGDCVLICAAMCLECPGGEAWEESARKARAYMVWV